MGQDSLENYGAYRKALDLFECVVDDMESLRENPLCWKLVSQQVGSADSIAANIEEGYGRYSPREYRQFLAYARGSARETRGRYLRMQRWMNAETMQHRVAQLDEIIGILTSSVKRLGVQEHASP